MHIPRLFHIGTQKAGSSYLYNLLKGHPDIALSKFQKLNFYYSKNFHRGTQWYLDSFPETGQRIDTSPIYFRMGAEVAPRIKAALTNQSPLFLLIIRNPIDYVHSHFQMNLRMGYFKNHPASYPRIPKQLTEFVKLYPDYLQIGLYSTILKKYWLTQFDENQFKILFFEEFINNTEQAVQAILEFFNIPAHKLDTVASSQNKLLKSPFMYTVRNRIIHNLSLKNRLKKSRLFNYVYTHFLTTKLPQLPPEDRTQLRDYFHKDVEELKSYMGWITPKWQDFT